VIRVIGSEIWIGMVVGVGASVRSVLLDLRILKLVSDCFKTRTVHSRRRASTERGYAALL
jgi:hypothetical protein